MSFHLVDHKGNHRKVKPSGGRVEMEGQVDSAVEVEVELELIQVDGYGICLSLPRHVFPSLISFEITGYFIETGNFQKNVTVRTVTDLAFI